MAMSAQIIERLAAIEHQQWVEWSREVAASERISDERLERWHRYWVPYDELAEDVKEHDRVWARKVIAALGER